MSKDLKTDNNSVDSWIVKFLVERKVETFLPIVPFPPIIRIFIIFFYKSRVINL